MIGLSAGWTDASKVAECYVLGAMIVFTLYYTVTARWWKHPYGIATVFERACFILVLGFLVAGTYIQFGLGTADDFLESETVVLYGAGTGILALTCVLVWYRRKRKTSTAERSLEPGGRVAAICNLDSYRLRGVTSGCRDG
jgi:drug/metabolite transporter (DMT)-like permease